MKKRILASTMASVMALSAAGTQLVSFAEVDAAYKNVNAVTRSQLKKFLETKRIVDLIDGDIDNYGTISGDRFIVAYQYAQSVLDGDYKTEDAATAAATTAFQMLKASEAKLVNYDNKQLAALVEDCKKDYNTDNMLNPNSESEDNIWDPDTFTTFAGKYEEAEGYTNYADDIRITTDAYEELEDAHKKLKKLDTVTKRKLAEVKKKYDDALNTEFKYQPWQRGTIKTGSGDYDGKEVAWGVIYAHILAGKTSVETQYDKFDKVTGFTETSDPDVVAAVKAMETAADVLNKFTPKVFVSATQSKAVNLVSDYQGRMVYKFNDATAKAVFDSFVGVASTPQVFKGGTDWRTAAVSADKDTYWNVEPGKEVQYTAMGKNTSKVTKIVDAELTVRANGASIFYKVDTSKTNLNGKNPIKEISAGVYFSSTLAGLSVGANEKAVEVNKGGKIVISDLVPVGTEELIAYNAAAAIPANSATKTALATAQTNLATAQTNLATAQETLEEKQAAEAEKLTALKSKLEADLAKVTAIETACTENAGTGKYETGTTTEITTKVTAVKSAATALKTTLNGLVTKAADASLAQGDLSPAPAATTLNGAITALITAATYTDSDSVVEANRYTVPEAIAAVTLTADSTAITAWTDANDETSAADSAVTTARGNVTTARGNLATAQANYDALVDGNKDPSTLATSTGYLTNMVFDQYNEITAASWNAGLYKSAGFGFADYVTSKSTKGDTAGNKYSGTTVSLGTALDLLEKFNKATKTPGIANSAWTEITELDNINDIVANPDGTKAPTSATNSWKLLYNYLAYALADEFDASAADTYTKAQVEKYVTDSYKLIDDTIETSMFANSHDNLVDWLTLTNEWIKTANNNRRTYKDKKTQYALADTNAYDSSLMYTKIKAAYDRLNKEYQGFTYSYGDIVEMMGTGAALADDGKLAKSASDKIVAALDKVGLALTQVEVLTYSGTAFDVSTPFNDDGSLNVHARVMSSDGVTIYDEGGTPRSLDKSKKESDPNHTHWVLNEAVKELEKAIEDATKTPDKPKLNPDLDGSGKVDLPDVTILLRLWNSNQLEDAKHDFDGSGKADLQDVTYLLREALK